jgi:hypothetical protein
MDENKMQQNFDGLESNPETICLESEYIMLVEDLTTDPWNHKCKDEMSLLTEPIRRKRPCGQSEMTPNPKRFFRTFWVGIVMRAIAKSRREAGIQVDIPLEVCLLVAA